MKFRPRLSMSLLAVLALICLVQAAHADLRSRLKEATDGFRDITLTGKVVRSNQAELKKIGKDFPKSYEIKQSTIRYKCPDKMRVDGKLGMVKVSMVINGDRKAFLVPSVRYSDREDIKDKPHKRQTEFDIGIITDSLWKNYLVQDVGEESGNDGPVYRIRFVRENAKKEKMLCWADARTLRMLKLEKYQEDGSLKSRTVYSDHKQHSGIWVPGRVDVYNGDGKLAGTSSYHGVKVNTGIADSVFKL